MGIVNDDAACNDILNDIADAHAMNLMNMNKIASLPYEMPEELPEKQSELLIKM